MKIIIKHINAKTSLNLQVCTLQHLQRSSVQGHITYTTKSFPNIFLVWGGGELRLEVDIWHTEMCKTIAKTAKKVKVELKTL